MTRVVLVTGKGGVGKTTTAAATAVASARRGRRTLVLSTDPAHSLADAFGVRLGDEPQEIEPGLHGEQLDGRLRLEAHWGELRRYLAALLRWAGMDAVEAEELTVVPGLDEVFALTDLRAHAESGAWDVIVVDCAPTAETVRLLSLPEVLTQWVERLFPVGRQLTRTLGPLVGAVTDLPIADDGVFDAVARLTDRLAGVRSLLVDADRTSVRLVVTAEQVVVAEARRLATSLALFGQHVDAVVVNRLLPDSLTDPFFRGWIERQHEHLATIEHGFAPVPVLRSPWAEAEPIGPEALAGFAGRLYGMLDPTAVLHHGELLRLAPDGDGWLLSLDLPFADKGQVELVRRRDELIVTLGPHRRALVLPDTLRRRRVVSAVLRDGALQVRFAP